MTEPLSAAISSAAGLADIAQKLGLLESLKRKLLKQPDVASAKLETVLIELSKIYLVLDMTMSDYFGLWLLPDGENQKLRQEVSKLRRFAAGSHEVRMRQAKGDCKKIWSIYIAYLQPWFDRILNAEEARALFGLFRELSDVDSSMVDTIESAASWLTNEAGSTLALVNAKDHVAADRRIQDGWSRWEPAATSLRESMKRLYDLRAAFIEVSDAV